MGRSGKTPPTKIRGDIKMPKNSGFDKLLAVVFCATIIIGFVLVSVTAEKFQDGKVENTLFVSDMDTTFPVIPFEKTSADYYEYKRTSYIIPIGFQIYNKTPVYTGNATYSIAINGSTSGYSNAQYVIDMPNLDNWVMTGWNITVTKPSDTDLYYSVAAFGYDTNITQGNSEQGLLLHENYGMGNSIDFTYYNNISLSRLTSLQLYELSQNYDNHALQINIKDKDGDGLSAWTYDMSITISGYQISEYNLASTISVGLGIATTLNIAVALFMTDAVDWGKNTRWSGSKKNRSSRKRKNKKRFMAWIIPAGFIAAIYAFTGSAAAQTISDSGFTTSLDLIYIFPIAVLVASAIATWYGRLNIWIALLSSLTSISIVWLISDYTNLVMSPLSNAIWYGYSWGLIEILGLAHLISLFAMTILAIVNLTETKGATLWR